MKKMTYLRILSSKKILVIVVVAISFAVLPLRAESSVAKLIIQMERLQRAGDYLAAMDTATYILTIDGENRAATDFIYRNWDKMNRKVEDRLQSLTDDEDLQQADERCEIYRLLEDIHSNLRVVKMPLYGPNERWVWQPEVMYYSGHYDSERTKTFRMLMRKADEAIASYDAQSAKEYYDLALRKYLITDGERRSQRKDMVRRCNEKAEKLGKSSRIPDAIFAYDLVCVSLSLDSLQQDVKAQQKTIQAHVSELYDNEAQTALQEGDSARWTEMLLSAEDWKL